jgi:hypothetical protein
MGQAVPQAMVDRQVMLAARVMQEILAPPEIMVPAAMPELVDLEVQAAAPALVRE